MTYALLMELWDERDARYLKYFHTFRNALTDEGRMAAVVWRRQEMAQLDNAEDRRSAATRLYIFANPKEIM